MSFEDLVRGPSACFRGSSLAADVLGNDEVVGDDLPGLLGGDRMRPDRLLVSPIMTNKLPWSKGYFETLANVPLGEDDVLDQHCFLDWTGRYYDENLNELPGPREPVGEYGLASFRTIDDEVSDALGFERVRD